MDIKTEIFGEKDGQPVHLIKMKNENGLQISCINYGCIITEILTPDKKGQMENVVLGFDSMDEYDRYSPYFGAVVGRVAGRIKNGSFDLDGKKYHLAQNENRNHIHGGNKGFSHALWDYELFQKENEIGIEFSYISSDGEEVYPGNLAMKVTYTFNNRDEFTISYFGISDKKTIVNMTNHSYFNLSGDLKRDILEHEITLKSHQFLELNDQLLPTGNLINVDGTVFDFRSGRKLKEGVQSRHPQIALAGNGYDHPFILNTNHQKEIILADEESGRRLIVETDEPCVVLYTGNNIMNEFSIRGVQAKKHLGVCLETQHPPDAIHHQHFPSVALEKGKEYHSKTKYTFTLQI
ncbi:aldose epimerase family protein [Bacillus sp. V5-8f]|uniref:aldose epimerase family protein n=1 Tax=Bacillus sp. V5-8f TaxID=2053044 RepID=UPI000C782262|nr:aldose epimerase family protein [Bacillus sp. V5-8f]PLT34515.1 galactose-1-epimerase [Bacillus sp. V5-8f]